jgi:hypothetical protein
MCGAIPQLPNTPSWRGSQKSTGKLLPLMMMMMMMMMMIS